MAKYTKDPDETELPCPDRKCDFVAKGKDAQAVLAHHVSTVHRR